MRRCLYQTKVNSASRLCSARYKRGGEGTNQQRGPEAGPTDDWLDSDHEEQHHAGLTPHVYLSCQVPLREAILGAGTKEFPLATQKNTLQLFVKVFQLGKGYAIRAPAAVSLKYGKNFLGDTSEFTTWQSHYTWMKSLRSDWTLQTDVCSNSVRAAYTQTCCFMQFFLIKIDSWLK